VNEEHTGEGPVEDTMDRDPASRGICLRCGIRDAVHENQCIECFAERNHVLRAPIEMTVFVCPFCPSSKVGKRWIRFPTKEDAVFDAIQRRSFIHDAVKDARFYYDVTSDHDKKMIIQVLVEGELHDTSVETLASHFAPEVRSTEEGGTIEGRVTVQGRAEVFVKVHPNVCQTCSRRQGDYFEAILQIRAEERVLEKSEIDEIDRSIDITLARAEERDPSIFLLRREIVKGGFDYYFSSSRFAADLALQLKGIHAGTNKISTSMAGRKDGEDIYRTTYLVRLPPFRPGDAIIFEGDRGPSTVMGYEAKSVKLMNLMNGRERSIQRSALDKGKAVSRRDDVRETTVVSVTGDEVLMLHPDSFETVTARWAGDGPPPSVQPGSTCEVHIIEEEIFLDLYGIHRRASRKARHSQ